MLWSYRLGDAVLRMFVETLLWLLAIGLVIVGFFVFFFWMLFTVQV
jgi:hypothetical protein